jgi:mono/diheme cytochrome c family protein
MIRISITLLLLTITTSTLFGCSMREEIRRIEEVKKQQMASDQSRSTNLTGEQIFIRSCNTCHPSGKLGMGPSLINMDQRFPTDDALKKLIRSGKGIMPPQPKTTLNDQELDNLVAYLRQKNIDMRAAEKSN